MTRDVAERMKMKKPCCIHSKFLPGLQGFGTKMSSSDPNSVIFLSDTPNQIKNKINKFAFSGGQDTLELQREKGANLDVDVAYHYLRFMLEDDEQLADIGQKYATGKLLTSEVKAMLVTEVQRVVKEHQEAKAKITDEELKEWMTPRPLKLFMDGVVPDKKEAEEKKEDGEKKKEGKKKPRNQGKKEEKEKKEEGMVLEETVKEPVSEDNPQGEPQA